MGKKRKLAAKDDEFEFDPIPKHLVASHIKKQEKRLIVVLESAQLETVKVRSLCGPRHRIGHNREWAAAFTCVFINNCNPNPPAKRGDAYGKTSHSRERPIFSSELLWAVDENGNSFELLNCDDHSHIQRKNDRDPGSCRPDITHQSLLMLMDSPLNRAGLLQVYIHTEKNVLIEINPQTRIPRTFKRFAGLMVQLLHKFAIRASDGPMKLLKVIKNPVTSHLPVGVKKITMSFSSKMVKTCRDLVPKDEPIVLIVGAMAHGKVEVDYSEDVISISNYPLSAALTCAKLCSAFEEVWDVV